MYQQLLYNMRLHAFLFHSNVTAYGIIMISVLMQHEIFSNRAFKHLHIYTIGKVPK